MTRPTRGSKDFHDARRWCPRRWDPTSPVCQVAGGEGGARDGRPPAPPPAPWKNQAHFSVGLQWNTSQPRYCEAHMHGVIVISCSHGSSRLSPSPMLSYPTQRVKLKLASDFRDATSLRIHFFFSTTASRTLRFLAPYATTARYYGRQRRTRPSVLMGQNGLNRSRWD